MEFSFPPDLLAWRDTVRRFVQTDVDPLATQIDVEDRLPPAIHRRMGEIGLFGMAIPKEYGGLGLPFLFEVVAIAEL